MVRLTMAKDEQQYEVEVTQEEFERLVSLYNKDDDWTDEETGFVEDIEARGTNVSCV